MYVTLEFQFLISSLEMPDLAVMAFNNHQNRSRKAPIPSSVQMACDHPIDDDKCVYTTIIATGTIRVCEILSNGQAENSSLETFLGHAR